MNSNEKRTTDVCLFFYVNGKWLIHGCVLEEAEHYGDFLIYPESHYEIWDKHYIRKYGVDYDYYPRGRIAFRQSDGVYQILYDNCIGKYIQELVELYGTDHVILGNDAHYRCHQCCVGYIRMW